MDADIIDGAGPQNRPGPRRAVALVGRGVVVASALSMVAVGLAVPAEAYQRYYATKDGVALRSGPGTQYDLKQRVNTGTPLDIECQVQGGTNVNGNATWDRLTGGQWVADYFTSTPSFNSFAPGLGPCNGPDKPTRRSIGGNPFAAAYSDQCTFYAEERMHQQTGLWMPVYGHAYKWAGEAAAAGWTVGTSPAVNSVAVFPANTYGSNVGHVAWVVQVSGNQVRVQDFNWYGARGRMTDHWMKIVNGTKFIYSDR